MNSFNVAFIVDFNIWYPTVDFILGWLLTGAVMIPFVIFRTCQLTKEIMMTKSDIKETVLISVLMIVIFPPVITSVLRAIKDSEWQYNFKLRKFEFNDNN